MFDEAGDVAVPSATIMDTFRDPSGVGFDISSFSFDVDGVAKLFASVGGGMEGIVESGMTEWKS